MRFEQWIKFRHFRLVVAIAEHGSISRAANALGLAQPTASKLLQDLEDALHAPLFVRNNRGVEPTEMGRNLIQYGRVILAQLYHTSQALDAFSTGIKGHVVLGTLLTASTYLLPLTIARLRVKRPQISLKIVEGTNDQLMPRLMSGELDFVLGRLSKVRYRNDLDQEPIYTDDVCIVARRGHPLAGEGDVPLATLRAADWILPPPETTLRRHVDAHFNDGGVAAPLAAVESVSFLTNRMLLLHTDMVGVWPRTLVEHAGERENLCILRSISTIQEGAIGLSRRRDTLLSPAAEALIRELRLMGEDLFAKG